MLKSCTFPLLYSLHVLVSVNSYLLQTKLTEIISILFRRELITAHMGPDIRTFDSCDNCNYESKKTSAAICLSTVSRTNQTPSNRFWTGRWTNSAVQLNMWIGINLERLLMNIVQYESPPRSSQLALLRLKLEKLFEYGFCYSLEFRNLEFLLLIFFLSFKQIKTLRPAFIIIFNQFSS